MATSIRIRLGLREFQLEADTGLGSGTLVPPREALRVLARVREPRARVEMRALAIGVGARSFEWDEELDVRLAALLETGRLRLREIEVQSAQVLSRDTRPEDEYEPETNEIADTHSVTIKLIDAEGNPVPGEPFRIKLPDGTLRSLNLDDEGKAHVTGIEQPGACQVCFYKRDASIWSPV